MATLEQIQARLKKLQAQADALIARKTQVAVNQIRELMLKHGLTTADIEAKAKARREAKALSGRSANGKAKLAGAAKGKLPPKYRDPKTGATWSGHARPPVWIKDVKDRTKFLIDAAAESGAAGKAKVTAKRGAAAKKATAKKAAAKKTTAAKKVTAKKAAGVKTTVKRTVATAGRKAAVKKTAAKKSVAKKATAVKKVAAKKIATVSEAVAAS
ncbi:H-NS histone family protein [Paraburkholderia sartisoli]|uniref:H-NS histone family protein n=1 Tax=Paraburkholderia sartisoli TaxID=83784 RepID=A0A1H4GLF7_9BURK|nr:H-NS histone family protein [Paraburkholderia sartisoli]SEB09688.1 H-NS histone family protein [Paraburkholderia sartisoli]